MQEEVENRTVNLAISTTKLTPQMFVRMGRSIMAIPVPDDMMKKMEEKAAKPQEKSKPAPDRDSL